MDKLELTGITEIQARALCCDIAQHVLDSLTPIGIEATDQFETLYECLEVARGAVNGEASDVDLLKASITARKIFHGGGVAVFAGPVWAACSVYRDYPKDTSNLRYISLDIGKPSHALGFASMVACEAVSIGATMKYLLRGEDWSKRPEYLEAWEKELQWQKSKTNEYLMEAA